MINDDFYRHFIYLTKDLKDDIIILKKNKFELVVILGGKTGMVYYNFSRYKNGDTKFIYVLV